MSSLKVKVAASRTFVHDVVRTVTDNALTVETEPNVFTIEKIDSPLTALQIRSALANALGSTRFSTE